MLTSLGVTMPLTANTGTPVTVVVRARDQFGATFAGYTGTVHFTSTDGTAVLPANSTLTGGIGSFPVTFNTAGIQSVTATDTVVPALTNSASANVSSLSPVLTSFAVTAPGAINTGAPFNVTVTAKDQFGANFPSYAGTVFFTSTDGAALLPAASTLPGGSKTFTAVLLTAGSQTISAADQVTTTIKGTSGAITATTVPVSAPAWVPVLPSTSQPAPIAADFRTEGTTNHYWNGTGTGYIATSFADWIASFNGLPYACPTIKNYFQAGVMQTAAINVPRFPTTTGGVATGLRFTGGMQVQLMLWNRDLTNAAWVPTNMTVARSAGIDGVAGSGSRLTATAANATILQTLTRASAARFSGTWIRRVTGTGVINMTQNGGTTWTAITVPATFQPLASIIPGIAGITNPAIGFQIVASGDAIDVDFVTHIEGSVSSNGIVDPIGTTTATVTQGNDRSQIPYPGAVNGIGAALAYTQNNTHVGGGVGFLGPGEINPPQYWTGVSDATHIGSYNGAASLATANATPIANLNKSMTSGNTTNRKVCTNAGAVAASATPLNNNLVYSNLVVGGCGPNNPMAGDLAFVAYWPNVFAADADLQALTT